jgi:ATP-dependent DNA helicase RecG
VATQPASAWPEDLHLVVQRLAGPIQFASRDACKHLAAVKNLGRYVSGQVVQALAARVYPAAVESDLLALRQLFDGFDHRLTPAERTRHLAAAQLILTRLATAGPSPAPEIWAVPIRYARGVGPKRAALLERVGIRTVEDALWYLPWRYEDRSVVTPITGLRPGMKATVCGTVSRCTVKRTARRNLVIVQVTVTDASGSLQAVFFNQAYLEKLFVPDARVMLNGVVSPGDRGWTDLRMEGPQYELVGEEAEPALHVGRIVPIYHETKGLTSRQLRVVIHALLDQFQDGTPEVLPAALRARQRLPASQVALRGVHFPEPEADRTALERGLTPAHRRLAFEELFLLELALALRQQAVKAEAKGFRFDVRTPLVERLRAQLRFRLTAAQERVLGEIAADMGSSRPMNRLLQGDVGCGKTVVALHAMLVACGSGHQAALMVPTEILAEQHYLNLRDLLQPIGVTIVLLRGAGAAAARKKTLETIASGEAQIVVGTHALIQKGVAFHSLGLAVIDEQHKFGVLQRSTLMGKGYHPDVLVMTATPIPRTLAMTVYGDLDVSVIDALPAGRKPVHTWLFGAQQRRRAYQLLLDEVRAGRQGYIVYPLVEESEKLDLQAAIQAAARLQARELRDLRVGLLHGRMKSADKEAAMAAFKAGEIQVLVTTTVIEVGVDVANATVILIEHAELFGLAQLHQLRGRVGRGARQSFCMLVATGAVGQGSSAGPVDRTAPARQRLEALVKSSDGFAIAEEDLRIRGPGEFFGVRQWGVPEFRAANLIRDATLLEQARQEARTILRADPPLASPDHRPAREAMLRRWETKLALGQVS